jgi:RNA polymerase sigma-70 factor (ECF subfamily)
MTAATEVLVLEAEDRNALVARLFDAHQDRLFRLARRLSPGHDEARDMVQDTLLRVLQSRAVVPIEHGEQAAWLVTTLVNLARDRGRRQAVRLRHAALLPERPPGYLAKIAVERALERLDPRRRAVLVLHSLDDEPVPTIAKLLGIAPVTVRWHLARARRQLASILASRSEHE